MMEEMSSLDIYYLLKELRGLRGGKIDKIYQRGKKFRIQVYTQGKNYDLILGPGEIYLSDYQRKGPLEPPNFCMFLRKHMRKKEIREIKQYKFDRVVEIHTDEAVLICELFGKGNFILVGGDGKIIQPLEVQRWSHRTVAPKQEYKYPPSGTDPRKIGSREFGRFISRDREVVRHIASGLNLGGRWAEEVCLEADVDKNKIGNQLTDIEMRNLRKAVDSLFERSVDARLVKEDGKYIAATPFPLKRFNSYDSEACDSFTRALDKYFSKREIQEVEKEKEWRKEEEVSKIKRIKKEQEEAEEKWKETEEKSEKKADLIYRNYSLVEDILSGINRAMSSDMSWSELKERVEQEDTPQARAIKEIREGAGIVLVEIGGEEIELDFRKSVEENAESFYEARKKADEKLGKVREKKEEIEKKESEVQEKDVDEFSGEEERRRPEERVSIKEEKGWYKKYRWFETSEGFLVVAGKNADQNEELVKKKTDDKDVILHAEIHGSPFAIIKTGERDVTPLAVREAAEFCASFSKAWKEGLGTVDVYWVRPKQVTKDAPSGEYIGKGSFMIKGQKNYLKKTELKISIGVVLDRDENEIRVFNGSTQSVRDNSDYSVSLNPGDTDVGDLATQVKNKLAEKAAPEDKRFVRKIPLEKIKPLIPPGGGILVS